MRKRSKRGRRASRFSPFGLGAIAVLLAAFAAVLTLMVSGGGVHVQVVFGTKLNEKGQTVYRVEREQGHQDMGSAETETPPPEAAVPVEKAAALLKKNEQAANAQTRGPPHPVPLATKEPVDFTSILPRNWSERRGARPALLVVHDTESPNVAGQQDVLAIRAWFSNPRAQASSNYTTDAEGNTIRLVRETDKAWTQAFFNPWSISNELIGHASQTKWPDAQLRAAAQLFAASAARWGIPVRKGLVRGCTIVRSGILQHNDLGPCGGGHHDAGPRFPIDRFISMVADYRDGGYHPKATPRPVAACTIGNVQRALNRAGAKPPLHADGVLGPLTRRAVSRYQRAHHLQATGTPTRALGARLRLACAGRYVLATVPLAAGDFTVPALFHERRGLFYDNIATTGGVRVDKLRTVPGGAINLVIFSPQDTRATLQLRDQLATQGVMTGLNTDPHWYAGKFPSSWRDDNGRALPDPLLYRREVSGDTVRILRAGDPVVLDFEKVPRAWAEAFLKGIPSSTIAGWRGRAGGLWNGGTNEQRPTAWTNEPHQATPGDLIVTAHIAYLAQLYDCCMNDRPGWSELQWLVAWGVPAEAAFPIYDAVDYQLDELEPGTYLFNQDRLRWLFQ